MSGAELMAFIKKNPISVGCGVLSVLLGGAIYFRAGEIPDAEATLTQKTADAERHAANLKNAAQLKEQMDVMVASNKEIDSRIIRFGDRGLNIQFFNKLAGEAGLKLNTFQQGGLATNPKGPKSIFTPIGFNLSTSGTPAQLIDFLHRLESGEHYCRILTANVTTIAANRAGPLTLTMNLEVLGQP
jgi:hypothetical protein